MVLALPKQGNKNGHEISVENFSHTAVQAQARREPQS